ncbi:exophilin-5 [Mixophyes fleayi]|uniref:exophilin-5 n=1 Tax=Mixophyes fleayi TaxID=3061075 RepID=UPI003F4DF889
MSNPATDRLDLSFLKEEEASQILEVLERDEQLRRTDRERLCKLKSSKRDVQWLHVLSGEWFEEIQKKKFKDDTDVRSLVRPPLTHHLKKKTPKGEPESSRMTTSRSFQSQKSSSSGPSFLRFRSPFSSLFSFRKSSKQNTKPSPQLERSGIFSVSSQTPPSTEVKRKFEIYKSTSVNQIAKLYESQGNRTREHETAPSTSQLEREVFQVLGDLDQKLAQEQSHSQTLRSCRIPSYRHGGNVINEGSRQDTSECRKDYRTLSPRDGRTTVSVGEGHTTHATYQPRKFHEMYSNRHRSASKPESSNKSIYGKTPSLCSDLDSRSPSSAPSPGTFSSGSLQLPSMELELERTRQHKSRRIPVVSIKWNNGLSTGQPEKGGRPLSSRSSLDLRDLGSTPHHNRIFDLYKYKGVHVSTANDFHRDNIADETTSTAFHNNSDKSCTEDYKTESRGLRPIIKFPMQNTRHWEEENKENAYKLNEITSKLPSTNSGINIDKEVKPMELENESSVQLDSNINAHNVQGGAETFGVTGNTVKISDQCKFHLQTKDISTEAGLINRECFLAKDNEMCRNEESDMDHKDSLGDYTITSVSRLNQALEPLVATHSDTSEAETMEVDVPSVSSQSRKSTLYISDVLSAGGQSGQRETFTPKTEQHTSYSGLLFTGRDPASDASRNLQTSFRHNTVSDLTFSKTNDLKSSMSHKSSALFNNTSHTVGRLADLNTRWRLNDNHTHRFMSDMMRHQRRNTSSLPDLLDQKNYMFTNNDETTLLENNKEKANDCNSTTISETISTRVTDETKEMTLDNNRSSGHLWLHNTTGQAKEPNSRNLEYLQKPYTFSYVPVIDRTSDIRKQKMTLSEVSHPTDTMTEHNAIKTTLNVADTIPTCSDLRMRYKSMGLNGGPYRNYGQNGADTNNNRQSTEIIPMSKEFGQDNESKAKSVCIARKGDGNEAQQMKDSECETSSKPNLSYQQDAAPLTNQQNRNGSMQAKQNFESEMYTNQNLIHPSDEQGNNKVLESIGPPKIKDLSMYPSSRVVEESLQRHSTSRTLCQSCTENKSTNLLKQHLGSAPEPLKKNTNVKENTVPPWICPTSSEDGQTPNTYKCESPITNINADLSLENEPTHENVWTHKTYSCERVTENTHIYETKYTDSSHPDVDKIEYHKVVSVYYSLPRKYSKRMSDLTQNNLKNIDRTLEMSRAPSALLDKIINEYQEAEENHDSNLHNIGKISPCTTKDVHTKELHSRDTDPCQPHMLNFHIIPLQTNLMNKVNRSFSGEETTSPNDDLVDKFSSLHISGGKGNYIAKESFQMQRNLKNKNEYSPSGSSPKYTHNTYYTLPNKKSSLRDLERNILEKDITMVRDRYNIYPQRENTTPTPPGLQDVFSSPTFSYDNYNYSPSYDFTHFQETGGQEKNNSNFLMKDNVFYTKGSFDEGVCFREELPSVYKSKSLKDLNMRKSYNSRDISPNMDSNTNLQTYNQPNIIQIDKVLNRTRPSYCSEFVQKKMKPINAKKFSFSFDHTGQQEYGSGRQTRSFNDSIRKSESPSVLHSPNDNYPSHVNKHYYGRGSPTQCRSGSNLYRSKSLKILNAKNREELMDTRRESDGSFSSKSYGENLRSGRPSAYADSSGSTHNRRFSADMIIDENDNWPITETSHEHKPVYTSKSLDYGIFGKEQQAALLNNVKRSLTEGRLWRPNFLKNPGFLRNEEHYSSQESHPISCSPGDGKSPEPKGFLNIYKEEPVVISDSDKDSDTTTDDEYYLDENDKESEL